MSRPRCAGTLPTEAGCVRAGIALPPWRPFLPQGPRGGGRPARAGRRAPRQSSERIRREVLAGCTEHAAVHRDVGRGDDTAAAHRLDAGEVEAFAEARADRRAGMAIEQTKVVGGTFSSRWSPPRCSHGAQRARIESWSQPSEPTKTRCRRSNPRDRNCSQASSSARWFLRGSMVQTISRYGRSPLDATAASAIAAPPPCGAVRFFQLQITSARAGAACLGEEVMRHHVRNRHRTVRQPRHHRQQVQAGGFRDAGEPRAVAGVAKQCLVVRGPVIAPVLDGVRHQQRNGVVIAHDQTRALGGPSRKRRLDHHDVDAARVEPGVEPASELRRSDADGMKDRPGPAQDAKCLRRHDLEVGIGQGLGEQAAPEKVLEVRRLEDAQRHLAAEQRGEHRARQARTA